MIYQIFTEGVTKMNEDKKIFCTQCGGENKGSAKFCSNCGAKLEQSVTDAGETTTTNVYAEGIFSGDNTVSPYEKITDAEEIKPEGTPAQEEIQINYGYSQNNNTFNNNPVYTQSSQTQYYSGEDTAKSGGGNIGVSIASLVCGILSILCCCATYFSLILAIAAIVLGILSIVKKYDGMGMAIAGIAVGGVAIVIDIVFFLIAASSSYSADMWQDLLNELNY